MKKLSSLILVLFSIIILVSFAFSAEAVSLGEYFEINYNEKKQEHSITFTAKETAWYEIALNSPLPKDTYVSTFNSSGKEIAFDYWIGNSSQCISAFELTANQTYTIRITCEAEESVVVSGKINKHTHDYNVLSVKKADQYENGYIEKECRICEHFEVFPIEKINITFSASSFDYNGKYQIPSVSVSDTKGKNFTKGTDYSVTYPQASTEISSDYTVLLEMKNTYYNVHEVFSYKIVPADIGKFTATLSATSVVYGKKPTVKVTGLTLNKDYTLEISYNDVGKQKAIIKGIGNYGGEKVLTFTVVPAGISGLKVDKATASSMKLTWNKDKNNKTDYYQIYDVKAKKVIATIDSDNLSYTVKNLKSATAYSFKVRGYSKDSDGKYYGSWKAITGITKTPATTLKSLTSAKAKSFIAKWTAKSSVTGYQIQYSLAADFSNATTLKVSGSNVTSKTVSSLKSGKKYYVRVRTYKTITVDGKSTTVYSDWSKASSVKVK